MASIYPDEDGRREVGTRWVVGWLYGALGWMVGWLFGQLVQRPTLDRRGCTGNSDGQFRLFQIHKIGRRPVGIVSSLNHRR